ncbi:Predicted UDP-galactose transporter [Ceraceosorus bombacis]|uniref:Predicted UDP-galactose transporter n=1 Tax=Ceraceosorus bombacis TaxID=401625 RepID=A0A0P1BHG1_9BASI|nr:Predicted UDP-galactose transporter [Ceraceosorus bombacis]
MFCDKAYSAQGLLLALLAIQTSAISLLITHSRKPDDSGKPIYAISTAVLLGELLKGTTSASAVLLQRLHHRYHEGSPAEKRSTTRSLARVLPTAVSEALEELNIKSGLSLSIPAVLYVVQSNLQFLAASSLGAAQYQILSQIKIISTAIFSACLLGRALTKRQWGSVMALAAGVAVVQISTANTSRASEPTSNSLIGFTAVVMGCTLSGFAGVLTEKILKRSTTRVLTEKILKRSTTSIFASNFHMSCFSIVPALVMVCLEGLHAASRSIEYSANGLQSGWNPMRGFGLMAWSVVILNAAGGLLVSASVKWVDSIAKTFASSLAILISLVITYLFIDSKMTANVGLLAGTLVILCSALCFSRDAVNSTASRTGYTAVSSEAEDIESAGSTAPLHVEMRQTSPH